MPEFESAIPRADIGQFPTPVEAAPDFGAALGVPDLYLKREDKSGSPYGGNKIRKLDFLLGDALDMGCSRVFTSGGVGSNHVLATATFAREVGLTPVATQFPQPVTEHVKANLRALAAQEPELTLTRREEFLPAHLVKARLTARFDDNLYYIPTGGSSPVGTLGFVAGAFELVQQVDAGEIPKPDVVIVPASSGGTLAGLQIGFDLAEFDVRVAGVRVVEWYITNGVTLARLANKTTSLLERDTPNYSRDDFDLLTDYLGDGYAEPTPGGDRVSAIADEHDIELDPTYTAKTVDAIRGEFRDETVLYWHTLSNTRPDMLPTDEAIQRLPDAYKRFLEVSPV